jgi:hypothetical protein
MEVLTWMNIIILYTWRATYGILTFIEMVQFCASSYLFFMEKAEIWCSVVVDLISPILGCITMNIRTDKNTLPWYTIIFLFRWICIFHVLFAISGHFLFFSYIIVNYGEVHTTVCDFGESLKPRGELSNETADCMLHILKDQLKPKGKFVLSHRIAISFSPLIYLVDTTNLADIFFYADQQISILFR